MSEKIKEKKRKKRLKKVPLTLGIIFTMLGVIFLVLVFVSSDATTKSTYALASVSLLGLSATYLDKSGVLER